jgi:integrase
MRGYIGKRGKGSWRVKFDLEHDPVTGKRRYHTETVRGTRKDAEAALAKRLHELTEGRYVAPTVETVGSYARHWLENIAPVDRSPLTQARYRTLIQVHIIPGIGEVPLKNLTGKTIDAFYARLRQAGRRYGGGLSSSTMGNLHRLLALLLKSAVKARLLAVSPIGDVQTKPKPKRQDIVILDEGELAALLDHLQGTHLHLPALLSAYTGLRRGEICGLRWRDLDFAKGTLRVAQQVQNIKGELVILIPKTASSRRVVRVPDTIMVALKQHRAKQSQLRLELGLGKDTFDLVFNDPLGRRLDPDAFSKVFTTTVSPITPVTFHALRHTHLTHLLREGVPVHIVASRAGHANANITLSTYAHLLGGDDERAAAQAEAMLRRTLK